MMWAAGLLAGAVGVYLVLYWLARRRATPDWELDRARLPPVENMMIHLAGFTGGAIYRGNHADVLINGHIFEPMIEDIGSATRSVHFETFVWWSGRLERRFADALVAAARREVKVCMVVDGVGSLRCSSGIFDELREEGVQVKIFSPVSLTSLHRFNERTHRKLLICDGRVAYTMGHGIGDEWLGDADDAAHYRDTGVRLTGPIVHGLQSVFVKNWASETRQLLLGDGVFPELTETGDVPMMVIASTAGEDYSHVELAFTLAIAAARREILIQNPYFAPDRDVVRALCAAARRGVATTLMLPGPETDAHLLRRAARHLYPDLIRAGVRVLEYQPTLSHQKVMVIDGVWSRIGSTNLDSRSLELNDEAGVVMLDEALAACLREQFIADARVCREVTLTQCHRRSLANKLCDAGVYLLHGQL